MVGEMLFPLRHLPCFVIIREKCAPNMRVDLGNCWVSENSLKNQVGLKSDLSLTYKPRYLDVSESRGKYSAFRKEKSDFPKGVARGSRGMVGFVA